MRAIQDYSKAILGLSSFGGYNQFQGVLDALERERVINRALGGIHGNLLLDQMTAASKAREMLDGTSHSLSQAVLSSLGNLERNHELLRLGRELGDASKNLASVASAFGLIAHDRRELLQSLDASARFRIPNTWEMTDAIQRQIGERAGIASSVAKLYTDQNNFLQGVATFNKAWIDDFSPNSSFVGLEKLHGLNSAIRGAPFGEDTIYALRESLGGAYFNGHRYLRDIQTAGERVRAFRTMGFDPDLTHFPRSKYLDILETAGFDVVWPSVDEDVTEENEEVGVEELLVVALPASVHLRIFEAVYAFENLVRQFIARELERRHGADWEHVALPTSLRNIYVKKREDQIRKGRPVEQLIAYADIMHYPQIMQHGANWNDAFERFFVDAAVLNVAFAWIADIRNTNHHNRQLSKEDLALFVVNMQQMLGAIGCTQMQLHAVSARTLESPMPSSEQ